MAVCGPNDALCRNCAVNGNECTSCFPGFGLTTEKPVRCEQCEDGCLLCGTIGDKCTKCKPGLGPNQSGGGCGACHESHCLVCDIANGADKCDYCENGYGIGAEQTCEACPENCRRCGHRNTTYCDLCNLGWGAVNGKCVRCDENCASGCEMYGEGKCDGICIEGYLINTTNNICMHHSSDSSSITGVCFKDSGVVTLVTVMSIAGFLLGFGLAALLAVCCCYPSCLCYNCCKRKGESNNTLTSLDNSSIYPDDVVKVDSSDGPRNKEPTSQYEIPDSMKNRKKKSSDENSNVYV